MNDTALTNGTDARELALLKAIGLDKAAPEQRELALSIAKRYDLDPMLKHLVLIDGKPYITRDGLLWVAHRSGQLDGIEVTKPVLVENFWECTASVYRKDMSRPFTFPGRFAKAGRNANLRAGNGNQVCRVDGAPASLQRGRAGRRGALGYSRRGSAEPLRLCGAAVPGRARRCEARGD